ncbi:MAG: hypothetical protein JOZ62_10720 [Acidobacteriaceae bacterium]|nr:hypothetical protein [Acidobacteriaceae bacterium]
MADEANTAMQKTVLAALPRESVVYSNSFATVMTNCILISDANNKSQSIISLSRITDVKRIKTSYPGLLVISSGLFLVAAAAYCSKDTSGADLVFGSLGVIVLLAFAATRKACVALKIGSETRHSLNGSVSEAAEVIQALKSAQQLSQEPAEVEVAERLAS